MRRAEIEDAAAQACELVRVLGGDLDGMTRNAERLSLERSCSREHVAAREHAAAEVVVAITGGERAGGGGDHVEAVRFLRAVDDLRRLTPPSPAAVAARIISLARSTGWPSY